jgi:nucleotide-binding universal stress UspA family protein
MNISRIVVGVDGSESSQSALRWAARDASRRRVELVVAHAFDWRAEGSRTAGGFGYAIRQAAEGIVGGAVAQVHAIAPEVTVSQAITVGRAASTLVSRSAPDTLIVIGNRGRGGFASLLLGSVSQEVAMHAAGPVVIVRGQVDAVAGSVVVGIDGSSGSTHTLGVAFDEAARRGAKLVVVHACTLPAPVWGPDTPTYRYEEDNAELMFAQDMVADEIARWHGKFPDLVVDWAVVEGHPAELLIYRARTAQLMVVGTRGSGGFAGLLLGSVSQQLLHHAQCPVMVVRTSITGADSPL